MNAVSRPAATAAAGRRSSSALAFTFPFLFSAAALTLWPRDYACQVSVQPPPPVFSGSPGLLAAEQKRRAESARLAENTAMLKSPETLLPVVRSLGLATRWDFTETAAVSRLQRDIGLAGAPGAEKFVLTTWSGSAREATEIASAVHRSWWVRVRAVKQEKTQRFLQEKIREHTEREAEARAALMKINEEGMDLDLPDISPGAAERIRQAGSDHLEKYRPWLQSLTGLEGDALIDAAALLPPDDPTFPDRHRSFHSGLAMLLLLEGSGYGPDHPAIQSLTASTGELRTQLIKDAELLRWSLTKSLEDFEFMVRNGKRVPFWRTTSEEYARDYWGRKVMIIRRYEDQHAMLVTVQDMLAKEAAENNAVPPPVPVPAEPPYMSRPGILPLLGIGTGLGLCVSILLAPFLDAFRDKRRSARPPSAAGS